MKSEGKIVKNGIKIIDHIFEIFADLMKLIGESFGKAGLAANTRCR